MREAPGFRKRAFCRQTGQTNEKWACKPQLSGEHTRLGCGFRRLAEKKRVGGTPTRTRETRVLPSKSASCGGDYVVARELIPIGSDTPKLASALLLEGRPPCRPWIVTDRTAPVPPNASGLAPRFFTFMRMPWRADPRVTAAKDRARLRPNPYFTARAEPRPSVTQDGMFVIGAVGAS